MECVNINTPEFKKLAEELGNPLLAEVAMNKHPLPSKAKEEVDYVFEQNPELTGIGTKEQYSAYLDTIFPDSKVKEIVYHGTPKISKNNAWERLKLFEQLKNDEITEEQLNEKLKNFPDNPIIEKFDKSKIGEQSNSGLKHGFYFTNNKKVALWNKNNRIIYSLLNIGYKSELDGHGGKIDFKNLEFNVLNKKGISDQSSKKDVGFVYENVIDALENNKELLGNTYVVFEPEQIHILGSKQDIEGFKEFVKREPPLFQKQGGTVTSAASPKTIALIKDFIKKIGVDIESLKNIVVNGEKKDANGVALLMQQLIQVVEGKEASTLPEEAMHFVVAIIKQKNPKLYKKLLGEINNYRILNDVFAEYGNDYITADGKPDIIRLKEEAIAKVLAEYIIKKTEGTIEKPENIQKVHSLWRDIIDFFKNLFSTSGFDKLSMDIITGRFEGTAEDIKEGGEFYSKRKSQNDIYNDIKSKSNTIGKDDNGYFINGRRIKFRVHDIINNWYQKLFEEKKLLETDFEKAVNEIYREKGDAGHKDIEYAFHVLVDENGYIRETALNDDNYISQISPTDRDLYNTLKENLEKRLSSYEEGTRFMAEVKVYDPRRDLAGTIDFIAITPEGEVNIIDWKFMNLNVEKYTDVPWYKVGAWQNQLVQYKLILQKAYGINSENFRQTRTIPIQAKYTKTDYKSGIKPVLISIKIGDVDIKNITEDFLLPVGIESERTRIKKIDTLIDKLNIIYKILSQKKVTPEDKQNKADQLNHLYRAIRHLQIKQDVAPLINQVKILSSQIDKIISTYNKKFLGKDPKTFNEEEINTFAKDVEDSIDIIGAYTRIDNELGFLFRGETQTKEDEDMLKELRDVANKAREYELELQDILNDFTADIIAKGVDVDKLLSPEKIVKGITRWLVSTSGIQLRSMHVLYRKVNKAFSYAAFDTEKEIRTLNKLKDDYLKWADSKGLSKKQYFNIIKKKDSNELIDQYDINFYRVLKKKKQERDFAWIRDNIDVDGYKLFLEDRLNKEIERIRNKPRSFTDSELADIKEGKEPFVITQEIEDAKRLYDISKNDSLGWLLYEEIKGYPKKELWYSKEWRELIKPENAPAKAFYDYISKKNKEYRDLGYISNARTFLPYVRKNLVEKLVTGGNIRLGEQFFRSISIDEGDIGYGKIDPLTGRPVDAIPKYFTSKIEDEVSEDLFHTMSLYNEAALRYKYLTQIEDQVRALVRVERNKKAIATSTFGKTIREGGDIKYIDDNNENTKLVEDMMKAIVYGQKFLESETFDQLLFKLGTWGKKFNEKLGIKVFPEDLQDRQISMNKSINQLNNYFQLNALGLNVLSASSNFLGGNFQSIINAGKYFTKTDYVKAEQLLFVNKFNGTNKKKMAAFLHYFLPLTENYNTLLTKNLSLHKFSQENMQDFLMILMRQSDANVQLSNFYAYLFNTIVIDGKIVNAREYVRALPEYENKYGGTTEQLREYNERFDEKVKELVDKYGILTVAKVENDELVIPGIARNSDTVVELRRKVQQLSKDALGNLTEDDLRWLNLVIYGKSLLMFKNWIPRLVDVRFGNIKYNSASDAYEWGRVRTVVRIISKDLLHSIGNLRGVLIGNERGVALMRELYEQKREEYEYNTDKELDMTETEFMDLVRANVKNQIVDIIFLSILSMMLFGLKAIAPDDDDDEAIRNQYRFAVRMLDKFTSELSYFYDPTSLTGLVSSSLFPSLSLINNFEKAFKNFIKENYAIVIGDEKMEEDTKVLKYIMKSFPFASQMAGYLPMFYPELAKDLGLRIQSNYSLVRR